MIDYATLTDGELDKLALAGFTPRSSSPAELQALTLREYDRLGAVAKSAQMLTD